MTKMGCSGTLKFVAASGRGVLTLGGLALELLAASDRGNDRFAATTLCVSAELPQLVK